MTSVTGLPAWFVGRKWYNAKITPMTLDIATGVFTFGSALEYGILSGTYLSAKETVFNLRVDSEEISPANALIRNHVLTKDDFEVTAREIKFADPGGNALPVGYIDYDYFLLEVVVSPTQDGTTDTLFTVQAPCVRSAFNDQYGEGQSEFELHGQACGLPIAFIADGGDLVYNAS